MLLFRNRQNNTFISILFLFYTYVFSDVKYCLDKKNILVVLGQSPNEGKCLSLTDGFNEGERGTLFRDNDGLRISLTKFPGVSYANGEIFLPFPHSLLMLSSIYHSDTADSMSFTIIRGEHNPHYSYS